MRAQAPKLPRRALDVLSRADVRQLEDAASNERDKVIVRVLADTGIRAGELSGRGSVRRPGRRRRGLGLGGHLDVRSDQAQLHQAIGEQLEDAAPCRASNVDTSPKSVDTSPESRFVPGSSEHWSSGDGSSVVQVAAGALKPRYCCLGEESARYAWTRTRSQGRARRRREGQLDMLGVGGSQPSPWTAQTVRVRTRVLHKVTELDCLPLRSPTQKPLNTSWFQARRSRSRAAKQASRSRSRYPNARSSIRSTSSPSTFGRVALPSKIVISLPIRSCSTFIRSSGTASARYALSSL